MSTQQNTELITDEQEAQILALLIAGLKNSNLTRESAARILKKGHLVQGTIEDLMYDLGKQLTVGPPWKIIVKSQDKDGNTIETISTVRQWPEEFLRPHKRKGLYKRR